MNARTSYSDARASCVDHAIAAAPVPACVGRSLCKYTLVPHCYMVVGNEAAYSCTVSSVTFSGLMRWCVVCVLPFSSCNMLLYLVIGVPAL